MLEVFKMWCNGKSKKYNNQIQIKTGYKKLVKLSGDNPVIANEIVETSLANSWQGLFELKPNNQKVDKFRTGGGEIDW